MLILLIIFTRLSGAAIIRSKDPGIVLNKFLQHWVSLYGSPGKVVSDNGGELNNEQFRHMSESFNPSGTKGGGSKTTPPLGFSSVVFARGMILKRNFG